MADRGPRSSDVGPRVPLDERLNVLRLTYLFGGLPDAALLEIARAAAVRRPPRGERIFSVGDRADGIHVVVRGSIRETADLADGGEIVFEVFTRGGVEGEPGTFSRLRTRMVNLTAVEDSVLLHIPRAAVLAAGWSNHEVIERLLAGLAQQVRQAVDDQAALALRRVRDRVALKLLWLAETQGEPFGGRIRIPLRMSQAILAAMVGASRENANRALRDLVRAGSVERIDGYVVVVAEALAATLSDVPAAESRNRPTEV